ncbi:MAG: alpha/beta hydrolase [Pseudomonadota bacterium]
MSFDSLYRPGTPGALVMLHGTGGTKESFAAFGAEIAPGRALLSLDGPVLEHGARRFFRRKAEGVYDMADLAARTADLDAFLREAFAAHGIAPEEAVGVGYSNGANILANLFLTGARPLETAVLMHPLIPFAPDPWPDLTGTRILITAGRADPICPPDLTAELAEGLRGAGADVALHWEPGGHGVTGGEAAAVAAFLA